MPAQFLRTTDQTRAHLTLFTVVLLWGGSFAAIKHLLGAGLTGPDIAVVRYLVAAPGFAVCLYLSGGVRGSRAATWPSGGRRHDGRLHLPPGPERWGALHLVGHRGGDRGTAPGITLALACPSAWSGFSATRALGLAVAFAGMVVVVLLGSGQEVSFDNAKGPLIVLGAPLAFALFNVITKPLLWHSPLGVSAAASLIGTAALLPLTSHDVFSTAGSLDVWDWTLILYLGVVCTLFAYVAWTAALGHLDASRAVAYIYLVPVFAVIVGAAALGEEVTALAARRRAAGDRRRRALAQFGPRPRASPGCPGARPVNLPHGQGVCRGAGGRGGRGRPRAR